MPKESTGSRSKPSPLDPTEHLIDRLREYDPTPDPNILRVFDGWPTTHTYRDRGALMLRVEALWPVVYEHLLKDPGERQALIRDMKNLKEKIQRNENIQQEFVAIGRYLTATIYAFEHLREKIGTAFDDLLHEAKQHALMIEATHSPQKTHTRMSEFAEEVTAKENRRIIRRLKIRGKRPKLHRGNPSKWTRDSLLEAMIKAVNSLREKNNKNRNPQAVLDYETLFGQLKRTHPDKAPKNPEATRKLIGRKNLHAEFVSLKNEFRLDNMIVKPDSNI